MTFAANSESSASHLRIHQNGGEVLDGGDRDARAPGKVANDSGANCFSKKKLESGYVQWEFPQMKTLTVDDRQRVRLPKAKAGQVFAYEPNSDGTIKLVPVVPKPGPRRVVANLVKRGGNLFFKVPNGYTLDSEAIGKAVAEEQESRS